MDNCIICTHKKIEHMPSITYSGLFACFHPGCMLQGPMLPPTHPCYHRFNDNLFYIEQLAKERNLI